VARRPASSPDVSVVVVHYETPKLLDECMYAIRRSIGTVGIEVFVIDNASNGFSAASFRSAFPEVHLIQEPANVGFAKASNEGLRRASGRYLLLLNPDAVVSPDTLSQMVSYMDTHPDVGCATCKVLLENGSLDLACRRAFPTPRRSFFRLTHLSKLFPRSRLFADYNMTYLDEDTEAEIDAPCGAFMLVRRAAVEQIGYLDESYFMYGEDLDWAFRLKAAQWRVMYVPTTTVIHRKRASSSRYRERTIRYFHDAMRRFYSTHYAGDMPRVVNALIIAAIAVRERLELSSVAIGRLARHLPDARAPR
jgi:N-acetylglucosaminyl-diphospho-decaprenol L-rhamnosyltransferase